MLLQELEVPMYIRQVKLSDARRPEYYHAHRKNKLPKKYSNSRFQYKPWKSPYGKKVNIVLLDTKTGMPVIKNSKSVGKPKIKTINGQDIYSDAVVKEQRNKIMQEVKDWFVPYVNQLEPILPEHFPIRIEVDLYHPCLATNKKPWDVDNHFYIYQKAFQDVMTGHKDSKTGEYRSKIIIPDDNNIFVTGPPSPHHIPVDSFDDRKMVFKIYRDEDPRIIHHKGRNELFKKHIKLYDENYRPY